MCKKCDLDNQQFLDYNNNCHNCDYSCQKCNGKDATNCTQCVDGLNLFPDGLCKSCDTDNGFYFTKNKDCNKCSKYCKKCTDDSNCQLCDQGKYLVDGVCINNICEDGTFLNRKTRKCDLCYPSCKSCIGSSISECNDINIDINQTGIKIATGVVGFVTFSLSIFSPFYLVVQIFDMLQTINLLLYINLKYDKPVYFILKILDFSNFQFIPLIDHNDTNIPLTYFREKFTSNFLINFIRPSAVFAFALLVFFIAKLISCFRKNKKKNKFFKIVNIVNMSSQLQLFNFGGSLFDQISSALAVIVIISHILLVFIGVKQLKVNRPNNLLDRIQIIQLLSYVYSDWKNSIQDDSNYSCLSCDPSCLDCQGPLATDCIQCFKGYQLIGGECKKCDLNNKQFLDNNNICLDCDKSCQTCIGTATNCTQCIDGLSFFPDGSCQLCDKNNGFYFLENKDCKKCDNHCKQCTDSKKCTVCESNFSLINGKCLNHLCEDGTFLNEKTNKCDLCYQNCKSCTGSKISDCNDIQVSINQSTLTIATGVTGFATYSLFVFTPLQFVVSIFDFAQSINFLLYVNVKYDKPVYFILKILDFSNFYFLPTIQQSDENVPLTHYREKSTSNFLINLIQPAEIFAAAFFIYLVAKVASFKRNEKPNIFMNAIYFISDNFFYYIFVGLIYLTFYRINMAIQLQLYNFEGQIVSSVLCVVALVFQIGIVLLGLKSQQSAYSSKLLKYLQTKYGQYSKEQFTHRNYSFNSFILVRKILFVSILVFLQKESMNQIILIQGIFSMQTLLMLINRPYPTQIQNKINIICQFLLLMIIFLVNGLVYDEIVEILSKNSRLIISTLIVCLTGAIFIFQIGLIYKLFKQKREAQVKKMQELKNI
ncbi:hypothetical protein ABPG72_017467 [Tetrahymena utriculariae]